MAGSPYLITPSAAVGTGLSNYTITYTNGNLSVTPAPLTITPDDFTIEYGQPTPTLTASYTGFVNGDTSASLTTPVILTTVPTDTGPGGYNIFASGATDPNYSFSFPDGELIITQAPLVINIGTQSKVYGQANPTLTNAVTGIVNDDRVIANYSTTATQYSDVGSGPYTITFTGLSGPDSGNYSLEVDVSSVTNGTLTVTPAPLTVIVASQSKVYGLTNPTPTGVFSGALNGDDVSVTYGTSATQYSDVVPGGYPIIPTGITGAKAGDYSYTVEGASVTDGSLTVVPAPLAIAVNNLSKVYGQADPTLTGTIAGILNGDNVTALYATPATTSSGVLAGGYPITFTGLSGTKAGDYTIQNSTAGTLTVTPAPLTVAANNQTKVYGQADPAFTASYSGFVLGQNPRVLSGTLAFSTPANSASHFGIYLITPGGLTSSNYSIHYAAAGIAVTPAPLAITAPSLVAVYGQAVTSLPPSYAGFVNGDTPANLIKMAIGFTTPKPVYNVGFYPTFAGGASSLDYAISYVPGIMDVIPAILTATPSSAFTVSGQPLPTFTVSYSGFVNGDTAASLTTPVAISTPATASSAPGFYPVISSGGSAANYVINHSYGILDVLPPPTPPLNPGQVAFVTSLYANILGRTPENFGYLVWTNQLNQGVTRASVAQQIYFSPEALAYRALHPGQTISLAGGAGRRSGSPGPGLTEIAIGIDPNHKKAGRLPARRSGPLFQYEL